MLQSNYEWKISKIIIIIIVIIIIIISQID